MAKLRHSIRIPLSAFCISLAAASAAAREITNLSIDAISDTATIVFTAGSAGDGHVLYYAWSNDGLDKGADIAEWPNVARICRVADDATGCEFKLPSEATFTRHYAARAFLATTTKNYDNFVTWIKTSGTQYIDTGILPNKNTAVAMDLKMTSAKGQQYAFGATTSSSSTTVSGLLTFCAYINGSASSGGKWSFTCKDNKPSYTAGSTTVSTTYRTQVSLDAAAQRYIVAQNGVTTTNTAPASSIATGLANVSICLFTRKHASSASSISVASGAMMANLYCYSCAITVSGVPVRNYRPAVKDGVAGLYDMVNNTFSPSASTTAFTASTTTNFTFEVDAGDAIATASPAFISSISDFTTHIPYVETDSITSATSGSKSGAAPLVLTGANDWGGTFTVNEGALIADFGQGLASTDNLVFNGGTYGLHTGSTFNWTVGTGGGETSLGAGATNCGFTAYTHPFAVVAGGDASTPLEYGAASAMGFNPTRFILNDDWATDTVTLKNGITGSSGDSSTPSLQIYSGAADAVIEGNVTGVTLAKTGAGKLSLRGASNSFSSIYPRGGTLVIAPPEGENRCSLSLAHIYNNTANAGAVVVSNATITQTGSGANQTWYGGTSVSLVGCTWNSASGGWYPGNQKGNGASAVLVLDNSTVKITGDYLYQGNSGSGDSNASGDLIITNNASFTVAGYHGRQGTVRQYDGTTVTVTANEGGVLRLAAAGTSTFEYHLHGGSLVQNNSGGSATVSLGMSTEKSASTKGTATLRIYRGGAFTAKGNNVFLGRYQKDVGTLDVCGGAATMTKEGAGLFIGYDGNGVCEVSDGGLLDIQKGNIYAVMNANNRTGRTGSLSVTDGGTVKARLIRSNTTNCTAKLVIDGGKIVANAGSTTSDLISGFTAAAVGVGGAEIDTDGQDKKISQSFAARADQTAPEASAGTELAALPAFTKVGAGRLELTGTNDWLCATCVSNGTLAVGECALPATTLRLGGGVIDLCGATHTVENLVGSGVVSNGTLVVTGAVWPGVGDSGILKIDATAAISFSSIGCSVADNGTCGCLLVDGAVDLAGVTVVGENLENKREGRGLTIVRASAISGRPATATIDGLRVSTTQNTLMIGASSTVILVQ